MMNTSEKEALCNLKVENFESTVAGKKTSLYFLTNNKGNVIAVTNFGGAVVAIMVPDKNGNYGNVIQGHDCINDVVNSPEPYLSTLIGRFGNRIAKGKFHLDGKEYSLATNDGPNALHGGPKGYHAVVWDAEQVDENTLRLYHVSAYGDEGFPGEVSMVVTYTFNDDNEFVIDYAAKTNRKTIINLTHHGYFSLAGVANPTPTVEDSICQVNADFYLPIDSTCIPTGEILSVKDTPFDFTLPKPIGKDIDAEDEQIKNGSGYDHCFVLNKKEVGELSFAASIYEPNSGRTMEVYTTEPGVQMYSNNWGQGHKGQNGATFPRRSAVCFEAQHFPDSPNRPYFPPVTLKPGEKYTQKTIYKFGVK